MYRQAAARRIRPEPTQEPPLPAAPWGGVRRPPPLALVVSAIGNRAASRAILSRFESNEHEQMGDAGSGGAQLELSPWLTISFGEMTAMAGDYFTSVDEMRTLAAVEGALKAPFDRVGTVDEVKYVLHVLIRKDLGKDQFGEQVVIEADARANTLTAQNDQHFTQPGAAPGTPTNGGSYRDNHEQAIESAVRATSGQPTAPDEAMIYEGFASHFLTDAYAGGHVRTPRTAVAEWWNPRVPMFWENLKMWLAEGIAEFLMDDPDVGLAPDVAGGAIWQQARAQLEAILAAKKIPAVNFGDLVGGAMHDLDNEHGVRAQVGDRLVTLVGDGQVLDEQDRELTRGVDTARLAAEGVRVSVADVAEATARGQAGETDPEVVKAGLQTPDGLYRAEQLWPKAVPDLELPAGEQMPVWQVDTVDELLADQRMQEALALFAHEKADTFAGVAEFDGALKLQKEAALKATLAKLKQDGPTLLGVFKQIIEYTPGAVTQTAPGDADGRVGGLTGGDDNAREYYEKAKAQNALPTLSAAQREQLIRAVLDGPTLAEDEEVIIGLLESNPQHVKPVLDAVGWRNVWQQLGVDPCRRFVAVAAPAYWTTETYSRKRDEVDWVADIIVGESSQDTIIAILRTCTPEQVRQIDDEIGGLLGISSVLDGEQYDEFKRMAATP